MKIEQIELIEEEHKTKRKFAKTGYLRLKHTLLNVDNKNAFEILDMICDKVDCNFIEVLDAINRTVR